MRSNVTRLIGLMWCFVLPIGSGAQAPQSGIITPDSGVGAVKVGSSLSSFETVFPPHPDADEDEPDNGCGARSYHWVDIDLGATGIYAYLKDDRIFQLSVHTPRFALSNGIKVESSEEQVKREYPGGKEYVLLHSGSAVVGGRDLVYWVDEGAGVAFELYWNQRKKQRLVNGIDIFKKGTPYKPESCVSAPQQWQEKPANR